MATINGVSFNLQHLIPVVYHRNVDSEVLGSDNTFITDMGFSGTLLEVVGYETTLTKYDEVISEFMKTGAQTLVHITGWQYSVYSTKLMPTTIPSTVNYYRYSLLLRTSSPYRESTSETTRTKTITTNNQEWSADNSSNDIDTDGSVDAVPDIQVTGGTGSVYEILDTNPISEPGFETISDWAYSESDPLNYIAGGQNNAYPYAGTYSYEILVTGPLYLGEYGQITQNIDLGLIDKITFQHRCITVIGHSIVKFRVLAGTTVLATYDTPNDDTDTGWIERTINIDSTEQTLSFQIYCAGGAGIWLTIKSFIDLIISYKKSPTKDPAIYNIADPTVKCFVANDILDGAAHRINVDGTGTINFDDDFATGKWSHTSMAYSGATQDLINDELDIADDGYIYWKMDTKGPVTGIPTLTTQINITSGLPTIQISSDASTWYDITTAIVDDVDTEYELDSSSLSLKGLTVFYWRIDCVKAAAATCSIKSFKLDINLITIDFEHLKISKSGVSTIRCDQDAASGLNSEVSLIYRDRSWPM